MNIMSYLVDIINFPFRRFKAFIKKELGWIGVPVIEPYRGFGNEEEFVVKGRVIEDTGLAQPDIEDSIYRNLLAMAKRYSSNGISDVDVFADFQGNKFKSRTDEDGYFNMTIPILTPLTKDKDWQKVRFYMKGSGRNLIEAEGEVVLTRKKAQFGVITDIDDTLLISHATNVRKKLKLMLFKNAKTRLPFDGVAAFYCALEKGNTQNATDHHNPFFYVSSSEWNLYDLLVDFCYYHNLPKGPFLLRQVSVSLSKIWKAGGGNHNHKLDKIRSIMHMHREPEFILIGDSGQHDAAIYAKVVEEYPGRIKTIYIRDVRPDKHDYVEDIANRLKHNSVEMIMVKDTVEAAVDALQKGYINKSALENIIREKSENQSIDSELQQILDHMTSVWND